MTFQKITSEVAKEEGLKEQVSIGNVREVTRILFTKLAAMSAYARNKMLAPYVKKRSKSSKFGRTRG